MELKPDNRVMNLLYWTDVTSMNPTISLDPTVRYVVQTSAYTRLLMGRPLSDRRISQLKKKGWYGQGVLALRRKEQVKKTKKVDILDFIV